jgi:hypothetical protein
MSERELNRVLTAERLKVVLTYDPHTGIFIRNFDTSRGRKGSIAGGVNSAGYRLIYIEGRQYYAHRLAVLYMTGNWPNGHVDHRDRNPHNNAFLNLRCATPMQNQGNCCAKRPDKLKGAFRRNGGGKPYRSAITIDKRYIHLGSFDTEIEAHHAYCRAAKAHYGEFARSH